MAAEQHARHRIADAELCRNDRVAGGLKHVADQPSHERRQRHLDRLNVLERQWLSTAQREAGVNGGMTARANRIFLYAGLQQDVVAAKSGQQTFRDPRLDRADPEPCLSLDRCMQDR